MHLEDPLGVHGVQDMLTDTLLRVPLPQALTRPLAQLRAPAEEAMRKSPPPSGPNQPASPPGSPRGNLPSTPTAAPPSWGAMPPPLSGSGSRELVERLAAAGSSATATLDRIIATLHFFLPPGGQGPTGTSVACGWGAAARNSFV